MARPTNKKIRRREIVEALQRVIAQRGYERSSVQQIAAEAGLAAGLVHYHFGSKQQILVALIETLGDAVHVRYQASQPSSEPREQLYALIDAHLALGEGSNPEAVAAWVMVAAEACTQPEVQKVYAAQIKRTMALIEPLLGEWAREKGRKMDARAGAAAVVAAIEGAYQLSVATPGLIPEGFAAPSVKLLCRALVEGA